MKLATNNSTEYFIKLGVLLDLGRYSNSFDYRDKKNLGAEIGDIVLVSLKGRLVKGLVVDKVKVCLDSYSSEVNKLRLGSEYLDIEKIIQKNVMQIWWRDWLRSLALFYKVTDLRMFKTALPAGYLGKFNKNSEGLQKHIWISLKEVIDFSNIKFTPKQLLIINEIKKKGGLWQTELIKAGYTYNSINSLHKKNLIAKQKRKKERDLDTDFCIKNEINKLDISTIPELTLEQSMAIEKIEAIGSGNVSLLWGETGSGKTEVYVRLAQNQILKKNSCLILAPEIGLIPQLVDRFKNRLKKNVFEYHSNCTKKYKKFVWKKVTSEEEPIIIIGTRSAIFLPIKKLGLIVIDEEHDTSYKQDSPMPCYDAREVALDRVRKNNIKLIFGSATPSMNIWKKVNYDKTITMLRMRNRISSTQKPEIKIVDMREEFKNGNKKILSAELLGSLQNLKSNSEQAIILVPRRGYNGFLSCRNCGYVVNCPNCDTALSVHTNAGGGRWLSCHWCDLKRRIINHCPDCNSNAFKPFGIGTQKVVEVLNHELPDLKILRFDRDTTSKKDGHRKILTAFSEGKADLLVGTQMLAKGIDIANVTLSVVIAADGLLHRPDIASEEKSLQLFLQLAGRSGRANKKGKVIFQTYQTNHPVIDYLRKRDYEKFLLENSTLRKESNLFPFCRVCLLKISGIDYDLTEKVANKLSLYLKPLCASKKWNLIGPAPSLISKIGKKYRWQLLLYGEDNSDLPLPSNNDLWDIVPNNVFLTIDINPVEI